MSQVVGDVEPAAVGRLLDGLPQLAGGGLDANALIDRSVRQFSAASPGNASVTAGGRWEPVAGLRLTATPLSGDAHSGERLTLVVPAAEVNANINLPGWLVKILSGLGSVLLGIMAGAICTALLTAVAAVVCGALTGAAIGFVFNLLVSYLTGKNFSDSSVWVEAVVNAVFGALGGGNGGFLWEKYLGPWAAQAAGKVFAKLGGALSTFIEWARSVWGSIVGVGGGTVAAVVVKVGKAIARKFPEVAGRLGLRSLTTQNSLRILPLGDSITFGTGSSTTSSYRATLQEALENQGNRYQFVGSVTSGAMAQPANEGHPGWKVDQISGIEPSTMGSYKPNVVLLDIGTNDVNNANPIGSAPQRLAGLAQKILDDAPGVTLLVGSLIPARDSAAAANMKAFNAQAAGAVTAMQNSGKHVRWVDMAAVQTADLPDGLHPSDIGYEKMSAAWLGGIDSSIADGWIVPPVGQVPGGTSGPPVWLPQGQIASGPGTEPDQPGGLPVGLGAQFEFADLDGNGLADYVQVSADGHVKAWLNQKMTTAGKVQWKAMGTILEIGSQAGVPGERGALSVVVADVNGDKKADVVDVDISNRKAGFWINGLGSDGDWKWSRSDGSLPDGGEPGVQGTFADIDGDGRADYLQVNSDSSVLAWINSGFSSGSLLTISRGKIATGVGVDGRSVRLADLTGDGKVDYVTLRQTDNAIQLWTNGGLNGDGDYIWYPQGVVGTGVTPGTVELGDVNGDKKADYLVVDPQDGSTRAWLNHGAGSAGAGWSWEQIGSIADGIGNQIHLAKLFGTSRADYLDVRPDGSVLAWYNAGLGSAGRIVWVGPTLVASGVGDPGSQVQFADINGDGMADYLDVGEHGQVKAWVNGGPSSGTQRVWFPMGEIASGVAPGQEVRFADVWGTGRADYLVIDPATGAIDDWYNGGVQNGKQIWIPHLKIATGVGESGDNIRVASLWGTGRADYLAVHADSSVDAWRNDGPNSAAQGGWVWVPQGKVATGVGAPGHQIEFADLTGSGRSDYLNIGSNGAIDAWFNAGVK
ncbi:FG-GAP-like repeat-containing protein [Amycolatopsis sp. cmx-4-68]|uniref:FG-GAP-like repeat-containing protein n=1 Tax=Amycolatopsis sp. cmx-4-68 TaxID=2790938 RepID=UPI00397E181C